MQSGRRSRVLHERFESQARETPDRVALEEGGRSITYGELARSAMDIAETLRREGVEAGALVGLHVDRSIEWVASVLGILRTGAAALPLPPSYPSERLRDIVGRACPELVVDHPRTPLVDVPSVTTVSLDGIARGSGDTTLALGVEPGHRAFVLSSSGSTGRPKMIVRSHGSFFHRLEWTWSRHPFEDGDVGCAKAHEATTHLIYEVFEPMLAGARTVILPDGDVRNLERFWSEVRERCVTRLLVVPSMLQASLAVPDFRAPRLRTLVLMGEYVSPELGRDTVRAFPEETSVYSIYGSTEASSTILCDVRQLAREGEDLPLGTPISRDVRTFVLNEELDPVADGATGRLYVAGSPLFDEYLGEPDLTASVLAQREGEILYDTRDDVRRSADGELFFVGRTDETVKIRGFRVDLPEVERAMLLDAEVDQAAVVLRNPGSERAVLIGFYVPAAVDRDQVYATMRRRLPDYMLPSALVGLDELPRTHSDKIDRLRLLEEYGAAATEPGEAVGGSGTEVTVARLWEQELGHRSFRLDSSFFEVGGSSLTVFSLAHRLRQAFGLSREELGEDSIYRHDTLRGLASHIDRLSAGEGVAKKQEVPLLVSLRAGREGLHAGKKSLHVGGRQKAREPLFLIASAGGTLTSYDRLVAKLETDRPVVGVRDPMLSGQRDPFAPFDDWVGMYHRAIVERQPDGPYHICAYSSAGAFGYELASRLEAEGREVRILALVDPLGIGFGHARSFGYWALRATWSGPLARAAIRLAGVLRRPLVRLGLPASARKSESVSPVPAGESGEIASGILQNRGHLLNVSALFELNTGLPLALSPTDFDGVDAADRLEVLVSRTRSVTPEVDPEMIERTVLQYELQVRAQHAYRLRPYPGRVLLVEPATPYAGFLAQLIRPYVKRLEHRILSLGEPDERTRTLTGRFGSLAGHYRSMRDEEFVAGLSDELARALRPAR